MTTPRCGWGEPCHQPAAVAWMRGEYIENLLCTDHADRLSKHLGGVEFLPVLDLTGEQLAAFRVARPT